MSEPKKPARRFGSYWICPNCEGHPEFEHKAMLEHLRDVHKIDTTNVQGTRQMLVHLDGSDFFSSQYEWTIQGLKFQQTTCSKRSKNDMMHWE